MTDIRQVLSRERTRNIAGAAVVAAIVAVIIQQSWSGLPVTGSSILGFLITGVALGSIYGVAAQGLVVTYATSGVFNFAQGAIGMFLAYVYWEFRVDIGLPTIVGILLTVLVAAPLMGVLIERGIMRFVTDSPIVAQLVVTIGLMLGLMGVAASVWNPNSTTQRVIPTFFGTSGFNIGSTFLPYYRVVTIATGIAIGLVLRFLLYHTRLGITMRAVVDNRELTVLNGARPASATMTAWALGSSMAALAGIFLSEELSALDPSTLTLFIVDAFAAAIIARLRSLPMAYVGGLIIGLTLSFQENFLSWTGRWTSAPQAIPAALLFIAVLFVKDARIKGRSKPRQTADRIPSTRNALLGFAALIVICVICAATLSRPNLREVTLIVLTAFVMLSLVPLTGWANQISLAQITLVGCGAFAMVEWGFNGNVLGLLVAAAFAVPIGMIMAGPAIRLQGIYLALATMAFARLAEFLFFDQPAVFGNGNRQVPGLSVFGLQVENPFHFLGHLIRAGRRLPDLRGDPVQHRRPDRDRGAAARVRAPAGRAAGQPRRRLDARHEPHADEAGRVHVLGGDRRAGRRPVRDLLQLGRHHRLPAHRGPALPAAGGRGRGIGGRRHGGRRDPAGAVRLVQPGVPR